MMDIVGVLNGQSDYDRTCNYWKRCLSFFYYAFAKEGSMY